MEFPTTKVNKDHSIISFIKNKMQNKTSSIIGICIIAILFIVVISNMEKAVPTVEAGYPPEVNELVDSIKRNVAKWNEGDALEKQGKDMKRRAAMSANADDKKLCAEYDYKFDRNTMSLVPVDNCPFE